jgi:3-dehydroquinate synthase
MSERETVRVELGDRGYGIVIGPGLIDAAGPLLSDVLRTPRVIVVSDQNVAPIYLASLEQSLADAGIDSTNFVLPPGENTKDLDHLGNLLDDILGAKVSRETTIVALGGGVVGDLAGFAASVALRGLDFVQIPTTLLAQVDSSVGGKTGINAHFGKNLIGAFHQPRLVVIDTGALDSLPRRELLAGYAEMVKYGLIDDLDFFDWLETNGSAVLGDGEPSAIMAARRYAIATCCRAKARVVAEDERETGRRALLNLGHTFGHALEAEVGFGDALLHGEAVAIGTLMAFDLSVRLGLCPAADLDRVRTHFDTVGLPVAAPRLQGRTWQAEDLLRHMAHDKKVRDGRPVLVLVRGIGQAFLYDQATDDQILPVLEAAVAA